MTEIIALRLIHVLGGVFWVGAALLNFLFIAPAFAGAGPAAAGPVMEGLRKRRLFAVMPAVAVITLLSGLRLMMIQSGGFDAAYFETSIGATFAAGGAAAIVAFLIGVVFAMPAQKRMAALGPQIAAAPDEATRSARQAEMARLQGRLRLMGPIVVVLLVFAAGAMAIARYA